MQNENNGSRKGDFVQPISARTAKRKGSVRQKFNAAIRGTRMMEKLETAHAPQRRRQSRYQFQPQRQSHHRLCAQDQGTGVAVDTYSNLNDVVVAGVVNGDFSVAVYNPAGANIANISNVIGTGYSQANAVAIDASGRILVAGYADFHTTNNDFVLARYTLSGSTLSLDTSFGGVGYVTTDLNGGKADIATSIALDASNGDILVAGESGTGATEHAAVVAYTTSGVSTRALEPAARESSSPPGRPIRPMGLPSLPAEPSSWPARPPRARPKPSTWGPPDHPSSNMH